MKLDRDQKTPVRPPYIYFTLPDLQQSSGTGFNMAPSKDSPTMAESLKKRKLDRTDLQEEKRNRKKQKSKRKSLSEATGDQTNVPVTKGNTGSNSTNQDFIASEGQLVAREDANGQLQVANSTWNVSKPIGGRMLDIDPIFSEDEV